MDEQSNDVSVSTTNQVSSKLSIPNLSILLTPRVFVAVIILLIIVVGVLVAGVFYLFAADTSSKRVEQLPSTTVTAPTSPTPINLLSLHEDFSDFPEIREHVYVYENKIDGEIVVKKPLGSEPGVVKGQDFDLSQDLSKIVFHRPDSGDVVVQYLNTGESKTLANTDLPFPLPHWSPNDEYVVLQPGTSGIRGLMVYDSRLGTQVVDYSAVGRYWWINSSELVFESFDDVDNAKYPEYANNEGGPASVAVTSVLDGKKTVIAAGDGNHTYSVSNVENEVIYYEETSVLDIQDWVNLEKVTRKSWMMNKDGSGKTQTTKVEPNWGILPAEIEKYLPHDINANYIVRDVDRNNLLDNWVTFWLYHREKGSLDDVHMYILNLNNPEKTLIYMGVGSNPQW